MEEPAEKFPHRSLQNEKGDAENGEKDNGAVAHIVERTGKVRKRRRYGFERVGAGKIGEVKVSQNNVVEKPRESGNKSKEIGKYAPEDSESYAEGLFCFLLRCCIRGSGPKGVCENVHRFVVYTGSKYTRNCIIKEII